MNKQKLLYSIAFFSLLYVACNKGGDSPASVPPGPPPVVTPKTCIFNGISQRNSGNKSEFVMNINYDNNLNPVKISVFDSAANTSVFDASLNYVTTDSIRIGQYQYIKLDAGKRVNIYVTKSDLTDPANADDYRYEYLYNAEGYLVKKNLYINRSKLPNYSTVYTYTNNLLTSCLMTAVSSGNLKVLESTLTYDTSVAPKTMFYCFPDGFEHFYYTLALNYGNRPGRPLLQVITKVYNPANNSLLDTWTTNYNGYTLDSNGYLLSGNTNGDLQQGMAFFYGKTYFSYQCQ